MKRHRLIWVWSVCAISSLLPTIVVFTVMDFSSGGLTVLGTELTPQFGLPDLLAAITSLYVPLIALLPLGVAMVSEKITLSDRISTSLMPSLLILPIILAALIRGAGFSSSVLIFMLLLCLLEFTLLLWAALLVRVSGPAMACMVWAISWILGGFLPYLRDYVASYLDSVVIQWVSHLSWIVPPILASQQLADSILIEAGISWPMIWMLGLQCGGLLLLNFKRKVSP